MIGIKQNMNTKGTKARTHSKPPRRTAIIETFECKGCGNKYFYRIIRCPSCESKDIGALKDVVIIP